MPNFSLSRRLALFALAATAWPLRSAAAPGAEAGRVLVLGVFHFDNPGLDAVRYRAIDVLQPAPQADLEALAARLAGFAPTQVLLEFAVESEPAVNARYAQWRAGQAGLRRNEIDQIGFRVAQRAGLPRVHGFDLPSPGDDSALWQALPTLPAVEARLMRLIEAESRRLDEAHRRLPLRELLRLCNDPAEDLRNKGFYMLLNDAGAADGRFLGADASALWWHRNLRMYARVQQHAAPGERVLVVAGSGHAALLRDFLRADADRQLEEVHPYL